jgi:hypothetical protein
MRLRPCWSCGSYHACFEGCKCAKCVDPEGYAQWRRDCPEQYNAWLERKSLDDHGWYCECPACVEWAKHN